MTAVAKEYIEEIYDVPGFFGPLDAALFARLFEEQDESGVAGDVLEIGTWYGRSAILLEYLKSDDEVLHVCDLFEDTPPTRAGRMELAAFNGEMPTRADFEAWFRSFHSTLPVVHHVPSSELDANGLGRERFRFVHVDGSHTFEAVKQDIATSRDIAAPAGVIVFDDFANVGHPTVAAALWPILMETELTPFVCSPSKLYVACSVEWASRYRGVIEEFAALRGYQWKTSQLPDSDVLSVWSTVERTPFRERLARRARRSIRRARLASRARLRKRVVPDYVL